jgi:protein TonB
MASANLPSRSNTPSDGLGAPKGEARFNPWLISTAVHGFVIGTVLVLISLGSFHKEKIEIEVLEFPQAAPTLSLAQPQKQTKPKEEIPPARQVFGVSRKALTDDQAGEAIKQGNTVAKAPDNEKLKPSDVDSLPIPADEYLVTAMPSVLSEVRIPYPPEAKAKGIEGTVLLDLLIDAGGLVRQVTVISGPGFGLNEAAAEALRRFKFKPALVGDKPVAVKVRYPYRFVLERT